MTKSPISSSPQKTTLPPNTEAVSWLLRWRRPLIVAAHLATFILSMFLAFLMVNNMHLGRRWMVYPFPILLAVVVPIKLAVFGWFGQFRGWWRYVGISDLVDIAKGSVVSAILIMALWYMHCNGLLNSYRWMNGPKLQAHYDDLNKQINSLRDQMLANPEEPLSRQRRSINERRANLQGLLDLADAHSIAKFARNSWRFKKNPSPSRRTNGGFRSPRSRSWKIGVWKSAKNRWPSRVRS